MYKIIEAQRLFSLTVTQQLVPLSALESESADSYLVALCVRPTACAAHSMASFGPVDKSKLLNTV